MQSAICPKFGKYFLLLTIVPLLFISQAVQGAAQPAEIVSVQHSAFLYVDKRKQEAAIGQDVYEGNLLETDAHGRLSLLLPDHALLKIGSETRFTYEGMQAEERNWMLDKGKVWLRGLFKKVPMKVTTPTAVIGVRGTEWYMTVAPDGTTTVGVMDGTVKVENNLGSLFLESREMALVQPGMAPVKSAYLTPENAVNWTLKYRGLWDRQDLERAGPVFGPIIQEALNAYHRNNLSDSFTLLNRHRSAYGKSASWFALAGFLELVSGNDTEARRYFDEAERADPTWALPVANIAMMDLVENKLDAARQNTERARALQPESTVAIIAAAYVLKAELKLDLAYETVQKAVALSPGFDQALIVAATIALEMQDLKGCRQILDQVSDDPPVKADKNTIYGFLSLNEGRSKQAVDFFQIAVKESPDEPDGWLGLGIALFRLDKTDEGLNAIIKAALIAPQVSAYQSYLAKAFFELDMTDEALASLERAKRLDPKDPTPYLYHSLWYNQIQRPGEAIEQLEMARKLNDNRAVFRSRLLLDQDQAVLMANVSKIYNRLGFDQTSIQEASQAIALDPTNEGAHRRLYFALLFDPLFFQQAAESELLLAKLFVPPTRNAVVFNEDNLVPYQEFFARSGFDLTLYGQYFHSVDQDTETKNPAGAASLAGKLDAPFAFHTQLSPSLNDVETEIDTTRSSNSETTITSQISKQDTNTMVYSAFTKWQPTPTIGLFADGRFIDSDTDLESGVHSSMSVGNTSISESTTTNTGNTSLTVSDFDAGLNLNFHGGLRGLFHLSYHDTSSDGDTDTTTATSLYSSDQKLRFDQGFDHWIAQGALWHNWKKNLFQLGYRYFRQDMKTSSITEIGSFTSEFNQSEDLEFHSGFLYHQFRFKEKLDWIWGFTLDSSDYESPSGNLLGRTTFNPVAGATWHVHPSWRIRGAYIQNMVGDRNERIQPAMIAGFPYFRVNQLDALTAAQLLQLQHKTVSLGLDYRYANHPISFGIEAAYDRANFEQLPISGGDTVTRTDYDVYHFLFYLEPLITNDLSTSFTYRYSNYDYPSAQYQNRVDGRAAYFFHNGLQIALHGIYQNRRPDNDLTGVSSEEVWALEPSMRWYLLNNRLRLDITGHVEDKTLTSPNNGEDSNTMKWILGGVTLYF